MQNLSLAKNAKAAKERRIHINTKKDQRKSPSVPLCKGGGW